MFGIRRNAQVEICPIRGIERYLGLARDMGADLTRGYLFRATTPDLGIKDMCLHIGNTMDVKLLFLV